jgi:hypothetical protein
MSNEIKSQMDIINEVKLQVGLLEKDVRLADRQCEKVSQKVSDSIVKLQEVNTNLVRMITIHEHKHEQHLRAEEEVKEDIKELHSRISSVNKEMQERLTHLEHHISDKVDGLRLEIIEQNGVEEKKPKNSFIDTTLEKYKWMFLGAALILGWIMGNIGGVIKFLSIFSK